MIIIFDEVINHHGDIYQVLYEFIVVLCRLHKSPRSVLYGTEKWM